MEHDLPGVCWLDGVIRPLAEARIPVVDHGLLYGDGIFEGIRFYAATPFLCREHLARLERSARALRLELPCSLGRVEAIILEVISASGMSDGYLRLIVTRGDGPLGIDPFQCPRPRLLVMATPLEMVSPERRRSGIRLHIASTRRLPPDGLDPRIKSLNYLNAILARMEAHAAGADEAILLNGAGHVAEGSADNIFIVRDGILETPPAIDGALAGITRALILRLAEENGIPAREVSLSPYDLHTAEECFLTGTGAELIPVREIDGRPLRLSPGPVFRQLQSAFLRCIDHTCRGAKP